ILPARLPLGRGLGGLRQPDSPGGLPQAGDDRSAAPAAVQGDARTRRAETCRAALRVPLLAGWRDRLFRRPIGEIREGCSARYRFFTLKARGRRVASTKPEIQVAMSFFLDASHACKAARWRLKRGRRDRALARIPHQAFCETRRSRAIRGRARATLLDVLA